MKEGLGIVIVNWNSKKEILTCLKSLKKAGYINNVLVVDNRSKEDLRCKIYDLRIKIIKNKENLGYAEGNNVGIRYLLEKGTKYILILNPDTIIGKDTVGKLLKAMENDKRIGIVGPKIYAKEKNSLRCARFLDSVPTVRQDFARNDKKRSNYHIWSCGGVIDKYRYSGGLIGLGEKDSGQYDRKREVDYISGTAMLVRREVFETIGLLESKYFAYYEDVELCVKAKKAGFKVVFAPQTVITHIESSSFGKNSPAHSYYMARNHLLFVERNASLLIKIRELIRLPKTVWEHRKKREKFALLGIRDYTLGRFGKKDY